MFKRELIGKFTIEQIKEAFVPKRMPVIEIRVQGKDIKRVLLQAKDHLIDDRRIKIIKTDPADKQSRLILVKPSYNGNLPKNRTEIVIGFDLYSAHDLIKLATGGRPISSYETVGHILHLNLNEDLLPYKFAIGEILLYKSPASRVVIRKVGEITNQFRTFDMEVLAGVADYNVVVKENGCRFKFDYSKVYWNTRLGNEHEKLVKIIGKSMVFDVMAGIGPFAIPLAKNGAVVYANDLNPHSHDGLLQNSQLNKVSLKAYNMDGRQFIRESQPVDGSHYVMNLPATAIEFLDAFQIADVGTSVIVHVYCFSRDGSDIEDRVQKALSHSQYTDFDMRIVRNVAPNKDMYCVTFGLTLAFRKSIK